MGVLAKAILDSVTVRGRLNPAANPDAPITLEDFRMSVTARAQELSSRRQHVGFYRPDSIDAQLPIFDPRHDARQP
jgi:hypothetical protein